MTNPDADDVRWHQRLANYSRALTQLQKAVALRQSRELTELEQLGLIHEFEFTHEMAWNVMKDYFMDQGNASITGSRNAVRTAFAVQLIEDGQGWMDMIRSRNQTAHTYNTEIAEAVVKDVAERYTTLFGAFARRMEALAHG